MNLFAGAVKRESLEELDRKDVLAFIRAMREEKQSPRTIANRVSYLKTFFHYFGHKLHDGHALEIAERILRFSQ